MNSNFFRVVLIPCPYATQWVLWIINFVAKLTYLVAYSSMSVVNRSCDYDLSQSVCFVCWALRCFFAGMLVGCASVSWCPLLKVACNRYFFPRCPWFSEPGDCFPRPLAASTPAYVYCSFFFFLTVASTLLTGYYCFFLYLITQILVGVSLVIGPLLIQAYRIQHTVPILALPIAVVLGFSSKLLLVSISIPYRDSKQEHWAKWDREVWCSSSTTIMDGAEKSMCSVNERAVYVTWWWWWHHSEFWFTHLGLGQNGIREGFKKILRLLKFYRIPLPFEHEH